MENNVYYHVSGEKDFIPRIGIEGLNVCKNKDILLDRIKINKLSDYYIYKIVTKNNLVPLVFDVDLMRWDAKNIATALLCKINNCDFPGFEEEITPDTIHFDGDFTEYEVQLLEKIADLKNGQSGAFEMKAINKLLKKNKYDIIEYINSGEGSGTSKSWIIFPEDIKTVKQVKLTDITEQKVKDPKFILTEETEQKVTMTDVLFMRGIELQGVKDKINYFRDDFVNGTLFLISPKGEIICCENAKTAEDFINKIYAQKDLNVNKPSDVFDAIINIGFIAVSKQDKVSNKKTIVCGKKPTDGQLTQIENFIDEAYNSNMIYDINVLCKNGEDSQSKNYDILENNGHDIKLKIKGYYTKGLLENLTEATRTTQISQSQGKGVYKDTSHGKTRFERKRYSKLASTVQQYNKIDMNEFFKRDTLTVNIPVMGESDNYTVTVKFEGVVAEIAKNLKSNNNKLEFRTIIQALTKVFNTADIYTKCTCQDFKYRFEHWAIVHNISVDDSSKDPGPGKGIANPNDDMGRGCKHILLALSNADWLMKVASCIHNYIKYMDTHNSKVFLKVIFPRLYGVTPEAAVEDDILPEDTKLDTNPAVIDLINNWAKNRGKFQKGSNVNPVQADKLEKEQKEQQKAENDTKTK